MSSRDTRLSHYYLIILDNERIGEVELMAVDAFDDGWHNGRMDKRLGNRCIVGRRQP